MANNFKNAFASIVTAGENYQSTGSATDNHTGPQAIYTANNGSSGVNSILVELDAANTGTAAVSLTAFIQDKLKVHNHRWCGGQFFRKKSVY